MPISIDTPSGYRIVEFRRMDVHGLPGVGSYTLVLYFHGTGVPPKDEVILRNLGARIYWGGPGQRLLGQAIPDQQSERLTRFRGDVQLGFLLPLTPTQLEKIEALRQGGDFSLSVWLTGEAVESEAARSFQDRGEFSVKQQDWVAALKQMEYQRTLLYEVALPELPEGGDAGDIIRKATQHLYQGRYDACVGECRKLLEAMTMSEADGQLREVARKKYKGTREEREGMSVRERIAVLRDALNHATHPAHHHTPGGDDYSRDQARLILGSTVMFLQMLS